VHRVQTNNEITITITKINKNYTVIHKKRGSTFVIATLEKLDWLWPPYVIGQATIFSSCHLFYLLLFFSSPNFSRRRLDVCHTSTHGVALVRISDAGLKCAARSSLKMQDAKIAKNSPSAHHHTTLSGCISQLRHVSTIGKKLVKQQ